MKIQPLTLSKDKAEAELKRFMKLGYIFGAIGLIIFWWLGLVAGGFGLRCLMLTYNPHLKSEKNITKSRWLAVGLIVLGIIDVVGGQYAISHFRNN